MASERISLIPETLQSLDAYTELRAQHARVAAEGQAALTREEEAARRRSLDRLGLPSFGEALRVRPPTLPTLSISAFGMPGPPTCRCTAAERPPELEPLPLPT